MAFVGGEVNEQSDNTTQYRHFGMQGERSDYRTRSEVLVGQQMGKGYPEMMGSVGRAHEGSQSSAPGKEDY